MTELSPPAGSMHPGWQRRSLTKRVLREPLVHFLLAGLLLFAVYHFTQGSRAAETPDRVELTDADLQRLEIAWTASWQRPPTAAELRGLVDDEVRQEILARAAIALGLDKDDIIIKRRLAQKMEFLADDVAALREPEAKELAAWFEKNRERFALPPRISFRHIYFSPDQRNGRAREDAAQAQAGLAGKSADAVANGELGDRFVFESSYGNETPEQVGQLFGKGFAEALFKLPPGSWQGPVESGYGWHLVFVDSLTQGRLPTFAEIEPAVKSEWSTEWQAEARQKWYETVKARYEILLPRMDAAEPDRQHIAQREPK